MSFDEIYTHNYRKVYLLAYRMVRDDDASKDIAQDVFIKLYNFLAGGNQILNAEGWLRRITFNQSINHIRDCKRNVHCNNFPHDLIEIGVDAVIIEEEERNAIRRAVGRMRIKERVLLNLYSVGMSYREISEASGIPFNSVGSTLSRTLKKLKKLYYEREKSVSGGL
jgi:RNA polymerase sigma-70 factor, ECF subfamily